MVGAPVCSNTAEHGFRTPFHEHRSYTIKRRGDSFSWIRLPGLWYSGLGSSVSISGNCTEECRLKGSNKETVMKTVLLAGGRGTRLAEETTYRPKPMVEIGGKPILWHIMNIYAAYGFRDFVIACGHMGEQIKEYFLNFTLHSSDLIINLAQGEIERTNEKAPDWRITLEDTGQDTMTGGRLKRLRNTLGDETFMLTYGDGVGDVNVKDLAAFHRGHGKLATVTAVRPPARFGALVIKQSQVVDFLEKPRAMEGWINGGFFVFEPGVMDYLEDDQTILEKAPLENLARDGQLMAYQHDGFFQPMDTLREKLLLESLWASGAPWKVWE